MTYVYNSTYVHGVDLVVMSCRVISSPTIHLIIDGQGLQCVRCTIPYDIRLVSIKCATCDST